MSAKKLTPQPAAEGERPLKKVKFSPQVSVSEFLAIPAQEAVTFHLLYGCSADELAAEIDHNDATGSAADAAATGAAAAGAPPPPAAPFGCEYYNQVFGEAEEINGYKGLAVHIWIALRSGHAWVDISYEECRPGADDVAALLAEWWPRPFATNKADFLAAAGGACGVEHDWPSLGTQLDLTALLPPTNSCGSAGGVGGDAVGAASSSEGELQLYHATLADTPEWFKELHARLEPLLIFTIDGANFIDVSDDKWEVVVAVVNMRGRQYMAGFMTLYNFYAWPMNKRPRVAQVLVMPTLQGRGYGRALVAAAYHLAAQRDAIDLTFEDPAPSLQLLREKLEVEMMAGCGWATAAATAALAAATAEEGRLQEVARQLWAAGRRAGAGGNSGGGGAAGGSSGGKDSSRGQQQQQQQEGGASGDDGTRAAAAAAATSAGGGAEGKDNNVAGAGPSTTTTAKAPVSHLLLPPSLQQRATKELKIHKHQVHAVWEALLYLQSPLLEQHNSSGSGSGSVEQAAAAAAAAELVVGPLTELIAARLERGAAAPADRAAARKKMVQVEGSEEDWFVYKVPKRQQQSQGQGQGLAQAAAEAAAAAAGGAAEQDMGEEDSEGDDEEEGCDGGTISVGRHTITKVSADEHCERLQEQVAARMEVLAGLKRRLMSTKG